METEHDVIELNQVNLYQNDTERTRTGGMYTNCTERAPLGQKATDQVCVYKNGTERTRTPRNSRRKCKNNTEWTRTVQNVTERGTLRQTDLKEWH